MHSSILGQYYPSIGGQHIQSWTWQLALFWMDLPWSKQWQNIFHVLFLQFFCMTTFIFKSSILSIWRSIIQPRLEYMKDIHLYDTITLEYGGIKKRIILSGC